MLKFIFFHLAEPPFRVLIAIFLWILSLLYGLSAAIRAAIMSRVLFDTRAMPASHKHLASSSKGKNSGWTEKVKEKQQVEQSEEEETNPADKMCPICHEDIGSPNSEGVVENWSVLPCGHMFGSHCIKHYIQMVAYDRPQCPICRHSLVHGCGHPVLPALFVTEGRNAAKVNRATIRALVLGSMQHDCAYCAEKIASGQRVVAARHGRKRQQHTSRWKHLLKKIFGSPLAMDRWGDPEYATARFQTRFESRFDNWNGARDYEWEWWWDKQALTSLCRATSTKQSRAA